jgi:hypothetical protein
VPKRQCKQRYFERTKKKDPRDNLSKHHDCRVSDKELVETQSLELKCSLIKIREEEKIQQAIQKRREFRIKNLGTAQNERVTLFFASLILNHESPLSRCFQNIRNRNINKFGGTSSQSQRCSHSFRSL